MDNLGNFENVSGLKFLFEIIQNQNSSKLTYMSDIKKDIIEEIKLAKEKY